MNSLFATWEKVCGQFESEWALTDLATGRRWRFGDLQEEADRLPDAAPRIRFPGGFSVDTIFETLRAWRDDAVLCPVEKDPPSLSRFDELPESIRHVKVTSGSTGEPRLVLFQPEQLAADAEKIVSTMKLRSDWPNLGVISMAHSYGFSNLVLPLLLHGIPLAWLGDPLPGAVEKALADGEAWTLPAVPAMWRAWQRGGVLSDRIRLAISAGAPLPVDLEREIFESAGVKVHNFYGSSECGGIAFDRSEVPRESGEVVGSSMDSTQLSVDDSGCLVVESHSVAEGYWPPAEGLGDGRFITSDLAEIDDGEPRLVRLLGRRDDLINVAGRKIAPAGVESVILEAPGVRHCLVFGKASADDARVQDIVACLRFDDEEAEEAARLEAVKQFAASALKPLERPRTWWICPDLEPDRRGKISRAHWRERFEKEKE